MEKKNIEMGQYHQAEAYIPKFLIFLREKNVIKDYKLPKEEARSIYFEEFKQQYYIKRFSFSSMFSHLRFFSLIKYDRETDIMTFNAEVLNNITPETNLVKRKTFKIAPILKSQQKRTVAATAVVDDPVDASKPEKNKETNRKECKVCSMHFSTVQQFEQHQKTAKHSSRMHFILLAKETNSISGLTAEITAGHGSGMENIILRISEPKEVVLNLINKTSTNYEILNIMEVNDRLPSMRVQNITLPCELSSNTKLCLKIYLLFTDYVFRECPLIIKLKDMTTGKEIDVLKNLLIQVQSVLVDDLQSVTSYKRPPYTIYTDGGDAIVHGEHTPRGETDFKPKLLLQQYYVPDNIIVLLNAGLKERNDLNVPQRNILKDINALLATYDETGTLNKQNYFKICQLLLFMEEHQMHLNIRKYDTDDQKLQPAQDYRSNFFELGVPGLAEHRPSLLRGDAVYLKESKGSGRKYEGIVHKVNVGSVILGFNKRFADNVHVKNKQYLVSFTFNRVTLRAEHQAIDLIKQHNVIHLLCLEKIATKQLQEQKLNWFNRNIENNLMQRQAIHHILSETSRPAPYLIFGPPGTGKTVTIVEAILQIWKTKPKQHMLVCTPSNSAADEITKRLIKHVQPRELLRYIAPSYAYNLVEKEVKPYTNYKDDDYYHPVLDSLLTYRIIITTLVTASRLVNAGTPAGHFSYVFIDESGQATESESLIPIAGILTSMKKHGTIDGQIILAGDPKQLGPIIHSSKANDYGFGISMLERLMKFNPMYQKGKTGLYNNAVLTKLVKSYRSHPAILALPNKLFYDDELVASGDKAVTHTAVGWEELQNKDFPVIFHSVLGKDQQEANSPSFFNIQEIDVIVNYVEKLLGEHLGGMKVTEDHIGIIAPYRKQVYKLQQVCAKKQWTGLSIGSVEQFQGQERRIIIVSTVRTKPEFITHDEKFHLGFLQNPKRFNVAITRAKALLIVVGNPNILQYDEHWSAFIKYCRENRSVKGTSFQMLNNDPKIDMLSSMIAGVCVSNAAADNEDPIFSRGNI